MTEDDARTKWCPHVRCANEEGGTDNRFNKHKYIEPNNGKGGEFFDTGELNEQCLCIASECMAWRWVDRMCPENKEQGYCGLAGKP